MRFESAFAAPETASRELRRPWQIAGMGLCALLWAMVGLMAWHTSRFPAVLGRYSKEYAALLAMALAAAATITALQSPRLLARVYARRGALLWIFVCCPLLILGTLEAGMRVFNLLGSEFYGEIRRYMTVLVLDEHLSFKNPSLYRGVYERVEISTNELGLRERPLHPHGPGKTRILVLGDSVAFGWGVKVEDAFPRQLERVLISRGAAVETVNSGVPGYNTAQELAFLRQSADRLRPDAVLLLYVDNDIDAIDAGRVHMGVLPNPWRDPRGAADYFLSMSRVYFMLRHLVPVLAGRIGISPAQRRKTPGWQESMASLDEMARVSRARGVPLAVFHFRMVDDPLSRALDQEIEARSRADGYSFSDTLPWFSGRNIRRLTNSFVDTHPNAEGHRILAGGVARFLLDHGVLGASGSRR